MAQPEQHLQRVTRAAVCLEHHLDAFQAGKERLDLATLGIALQHRAFLVVNTMQGKRLLGGVGGNAYTSCSALRSGTGFMC